MKGSMHGKSDGAFLTGPLPCLHCSFKKYVALVTRIFRFRAKDWLTIVESVKRKKCVSVTILVVVEKAKVKSDGKFPTSLLASDDLGRWLTEVQASTRPK